MTFIDPRKRDIFGGTSQTTVDWVKKVATETNNQQVLDTIKKQEQEKIRDTMLGTNTSTGTTTQSSVPKTATGTVGGTPQGASGNTQTTNNTLVKGGERTYAQINSGKNTGASTNKTAGGSANTANAGMSGSTAKANAAGMPVINPLAPKSNTPAYTDIAGQKDYAKTLGDKLGSGQSGTDGKSYLAESLDQLVRGNYSGDVTGLGTTLQVISGILGLDTAADVRDLYYDVTHWDGSKEHIIQTLLDVVGLIPVVGSLKYADEVGTLVKQEIKGADKAAATAAKTADKQVYKLPAGYKQSLNFTDEQLAKGWKIPKSSKPSLNFTDEELLKSWKTPEKGAVSNAVEDGGAKEIAGKNGTGYNGSKIEDAGKVEKFFDDDQLITEPNKAYFWSGNSNGIGGKEFAREYASKNSGITLEALMESKGIKMPIWDISNPIAQKAWDNASATYARQVSGEVRAIIGKRVRSNSIWQTIELPSLIDNPNVTKVIIIDPETLVERVIFRR